MNRPRERKTKGETECRTNIKKGQINRQKNGKIDGHKCKTIYIQKERQTEGQIRHTEGQIRQTEGKIRQTEGQIKQTEGQTRPDKRTN